MPGPGGRGHMPHRGPGGGMPHGGFGGPGGHMPHRRRPGGPPPFGRPGGPPPPPYGGRWGGPRTGCCLPGCLMYVLGAGGIVALLVMGIGALF